MCEQLEDERNDEQGLLCMCGDEGQEAALSQIRLRSTEAVTTLGPGQEERKERNLLARSGLLKISQLGFFGFLGFFQAIVQHSLFCVFFPFLPRQDF